jgi:hypothetical protein
MKYIYVLMSLVMFGLWACSSSNDDTVVDEEIVLDGKTDTANRPIGTFIHKDAVAGQLTTLVLKTDKTFHRETLVICVMAPCNPVGEDGTYKWTKGGGTTYIRFYDGNGDSIDRYAYTYKGTTLKLRKEKATTSHSFALQDTAWCYEREDCSVQNLVTPECVGEWECNNKSCSYDCSSMTACESAGGECVALTPDSCSDGVIGDANEFSCGGGLGVMCCLPKNECTSAGGQCVALTPDSCSEGIVGDANNYSCGGGLGVECCLPYWACKPTCAYTGTADEGWYDCIGKLLCKAKCKDGTAGCDAVGSRSEGWYTTGGKGCGGADLIVWSDCSE